MNVFLSYARADADFALHLATDLRAAGVDLWVDQLDIPKGAIWDQEVERALRACSHILIVMSPASVNSHNVMDEVSFALEEGMTVVPVLFQPCDRPFRLRRFQYVDFTSDYGNGLSALTLALPRVKESRDSSIPTASPPHTEFHHERIQIPESGKRLPAQEQVLQQPSNERQAFPTSATLSPLLTELELGEERILHDTKSILCVAFSPTGDMLASGGGSQGIFFSSDFTIRLWGVTNGKLLAELTLHKTPVTCVAFSPDGGMLASSSLDAVRLWRMPDGKLLRTLEDDEEICGFGPIAFSPDGSVLAAGAHLWRVSDGQRLRPLPGGEILHSLDLNYSLVFQGFAFSLDWALIAVSSNGKDIRVLRVADGKSVLAIQAKEISNVWDLAFSPDGSMLALSWNWKDDNQVVVLSVPDGKKRILATRMGGGMVAFSNDGKFLAFGQRTSAEIHVWRIADWQLVAEQKLPGKSLGSTGYHSVTLAADNKWLAAGFADKAIRLWPLLERTVR